MHHALLCNPPTPQKKGGRGGVGVFGFTVLVIFLDRFFWGRGALKYPENVVNPQKRKSTRIAAVSSLVDLQF